MNITNMEKLILNSIIKTGVYHKFKYVNLITGFHTSQNLPKITPYTSG